MCLRTLLGPAVACNTYSVPTTKRQARPPLAPAEQPREQRKRAVIYARVSVDTGSKSPSDQIRECRAAAEREGWEVVDAIPESGSASRHARKARARWPEVAALIKSGAVDVLMTWEFSRATRELDFYAALRNTCAEAKVRWWYGGSVFDLSKREDRFRTGLDALRAEDEADQISERALRGHRGGAERRRPTVGSAPFGFVRVYDPRTGTLIGQEHDPVQAPIARELVQRVLSSESLRSIVRDLNARGIPTPRKGEWTVPGLRQVVMRPALAGLRIHRRVVVGEGTWTPIITLEDHQAIVELLTDPARRTSRETAVRHLLTGIARCGVCQATVRCLPLRGRPKLQCRNFHVVRDEEFVDGIVRAAIIKRMSQPDAAAVFLRDTSSESRAARDQLASLRLRMEQAYQQATMDDDDERLSPAGVARMERDLLPQIEAAEKRLGHLRRAQSPLVARLAEGDAARVWDDELDVAQHREVVRTLTTVHIHRVTTRSRPDVRSVRIAFVPQSSSE